MFDGRSPPRAYVKTAIMFDREALVHQVNEQLSTGGDIAQPAQPCLLGLGRGERVGRYLEKR